jgi:hypothetical protein
LKGRTEWRKKKKKMGANTVMKHSMFYSICQVFAHSFYGMLICVASAEFLGFSMAKAVLCQR